MSNGGKQEFFIILNFTYILLKVKSKYKWRYIKQANKHLNIKFCKHYLLYQFSNSIYFLQHNYLFENCNRPLVEFDQILRFGQNNCWLHSCHLYHNLHIFRLCQMVDCHIHIGWIFLQQDDNFPNDFRDTSSRIYTII